MRVAGVCAPHVRLRPCPFALRRASLSLLWSLNSFFVSVVITLVCPLSVFPTLSTTAHPLAQKTRDRALYSRRPLSEDLANQARYLDQLGRHGSQFIDEIRYRRGIRLPARGTDGILPTTTPADQKSSMGAAWPETEASRASLVTNGAPSFSASTM